MATNNFSVPEFILPYGAKMAPGLDCSVEPSLTKQSFADECDINNIMRRYEKTRVFDFVNQNELRYGDATALDYQTALNIVINAENLFSELPGKLRQRFSNDPAEFLAFVQDSRNRDEAVTLGLLKPQPPSEPATPVVAKDGAAGGA